MTPGEQTPDFLLKHLRISTFFSGHAYRVEFAAAVVHLVHKLVRDYHALVRTSVDVDSSVAPVHTYHLEIGILNFNV